MDLSLGAGISAFTVFLQGLLSFLSPCVLPLLPLYIGYLAGGVKVVDADGTVRYPRARMLVNTLFFILGISCAFFLLGFGFSALGQWLADYRLLVTRLGGILIALFGAYQLFGAGALGREHRLPLRLDKLTMNPVVALLFGFTFSFAWTPCVGPALTSVLLLTASAQTAGSGFLLIGVYTLGFVLPFLAVGFFTGSLLKFFRKYRGVVKYTVKIGGVLLIIMGILMFSGTMNSLTSYFANLTGNGAGSGQNAELNTAPPPDRNPAADEPVAAPNFTLNDQQGVSHTLSDYRGKTVLLNFWATWCGYCQKEMPDLEALYQEYGQNEQDLVILGLATPDHDELSAAEITKFLADQGYAYPTLFDKSAAVFAAYLVNSLPTSVLIDKNGNVAIYIPGALPKLQLEELIKQVLAIPAI